MDISTVEPEYKISFGVLENIPELSGKTVIVKASSKSLAVQKAIEEIPGANKFPLSVLKYLAKIERTDIEEEDKITKLERLLREILKVANKELQEGPNKTIFLNQIVELLDLIK